MRGKRLGIVAGVVIVLVGAGLYFLFAPGAPEPTQLTWEHTYGGSGRDEATHIAPTSDGGAVIAGDRTQDGTSNVDAWVIRLDKQGSTVWERTWGGPDDEHVEDVRATTDGEFIVTGETQGATIGLGQVWVSKLDGDGKTVWMHTYDSGRKGAAHSVLPTADGGYVVAGTEPGRVANYYDGWVAKIDAQGKLEWEYTYGGADDESIAAIRDTPDGGFVFVGATQSEGEGRTDAWIVKLDGSGQMQWEHTYGSPQPDEAMDVVTLSDQGFIVAGWTDRKVDRDKRDGWLLRLDAKGERIWEHTYGGREADLAYSIRPTNDGGFVVAGATASFGEGRMDAWVFKVDKDGNQLWNQALGGKDDEQATAVEPMLDGAFVVAGREASHGAGREDAWILRLNELGRISKVN